jgi:hypothetical protein
MRSNLVRATVGWGVVFALVHFYWAAGGELGMNGEAADTLAAQVYIAVIAVLGLAGAAVARGLVRRRSRMLVLLARAGGAALLIGVAVGVGRWAVAGGLEDDGAAGVVTTLYFLLGGVLFWSLGRGDDSRARTGS